MGIRRVENMCGGKGHVIIKDILEELLIAAAQRSNQHGCPADIVDRILHRRDEAVENRALDIDARRRGAGLALAREAHGGQRAGDGLLEVAVGEDQRSVLAPLQPVLHSIRFQTINGLSKILDRL